MLMKKLNIAMQIVEHIKNEAFKDNMVNYY